MNAKRNALGKGLGALLHDASEIISNNNSASAAPNPRNPIASINEIPINEITPNPYQPRTVFDAEAIEELAESIRNVGIIQPLTLRRIAENKYQIISGERRFRAARSAGLATVPAYIRSTDDRGMLEMALIENIQRKDLDPVETALSYQRLIEECNFTQEELAGRVGKGRVTVTNSLRLLKLPAELQKALRMGKISVGHAKVLLSVDDESDQLTLCEKIIRKDLSVRALEAEVKKMSQSKSDNQSETEEALPDSCYRLLEVVGKYFNNNISLSRTKEGSGKVTIRFKNDAEIESFLKVLESNSL
ncbi:MAG: ParB/RepB/Spo0J family partition protein [Bacteroidales bacterium]|nr:ParB/RepB/Spo0J family partition protein [Bacteroidales bacterium]